LLIIIANLPISCRNNSKSESLKKTDFGAIVKIIDFPFIIANPAVPPLQTTGLKIGNSALFSFFSTLIAYEISFIVGIRKWNIIRKLPLRIDGIAKMPNQSNNISGDNQYINSRR
jgi:hypothetical protein